MRLTVLALIAAVLMLPACARASSTAPGYVPWLPLSPGNVIPQAPAPSPAPPIPIPVGTPECAAAQLDAVVGMGGGATGHVNIPVQLRNRSATRCFVQGYPDVTILGGGGGVLAQAAGTANRGTFFDYPNWAVPMLMELGTTFADPHTTPPEGQARFNIEWYDCSTPTAVRLVIDLPDETGRISLDFGYKPPTYSPACDSGVAPRSSIARGPFTPTGVEWPPGSKYRQVALSIDRPDSVRRGDTLIYFVQIRNLGSDDYVLTPCPDYIEILGWKAAVAKYRLNCGPVGHIAPGNSAEFEMRLNVPSSMPVGRTQVDWALLDFRIVPSHKEATVAIT